MTNRNIFENKLCKYVPNYHGLSDDDKLQIVLDFKPLWKKVNGNRPCEAIYIIYICQEHLSECTMHEFLSFFDMNVLLTLVNKLYLLTYLITCVLLYFTTFLII